MPQKPPRRIFVDALPVYTLLVFLSFGHVNACVPSQRSAHKVGRYSLRLSRLMGSELCNAFATQDSGDLRRHAPLWGVDVAPYRRGM